MSSAVTSIDLIITEYRDPNFIQQIRIVGNTEELGSLVPLHPPM